ncbi:PFDN1 [Bugula neritina]|uniref:PFDN1 n=1 Tax=Bugula neritina TaxID=10212 RepID=A0A7J7IXS2_BUGNE|nr:PFDN1 [Bugula neritina]
MAAAGLPVDLELKKAFQELQNKLVGTKQQLKVNDAQIDGLRKKIQHGEIVKKEISSLSAATPTYESVGRMFVLTPQAAVLKSLNAQSKANSDKIKTIEYDFVKWYHFGLAGASYEPSIW